MNHLIVTRLNDVNLKASEVSFVFDRKNIPFNAISNVNWTNYPYKPDVKFRIAHNGQSIFLNYQVEESDIQAVCDVDNGPVWKDSCVEFFVSFGDDFYYNIECNCIGKILIAKRMDKSNRMPVSESLLALIDRWSSLGNLPVENQSGKWELSLVIPLEVFSLNGINTLDGLEAKGNFYKCGDNLKVPHYLSWNPIKNEKPNFHLPQFFEKISFNYQ
ncbi:hypothetical protein FACS1894182_04620 [Bacteroidia bacterium]|nr:hypothetical protein FACS1894182_04620 [Bacteroidia bacterium]